MNAAEYQPGGTQWEKVQVVMNAHACSRLRAVSALKACRNDEVAAIESLKDILSLSINSMSLSSSKNDYILIERGGDDKAASQVNAVTMGSQGDKGKGGQTRSDYPPAELEDNLGRTHGDSSRGDHTLPEPVEGGGFVDGRADNISSKHDCWADTDHQYVTVADNGPPRSLKSLLTTNESEIPPSPITLPLQWDFVLPTMHLDPSEPEFSPEEGLSRGFSLRRLIPALQSGVQRGKVQHYLSLFSDTVLSEKLNATLAGFPAMFYAVATNDEKIVRTFVNYGAQVNIVDQTYNIPLLAFAILVSGALQKDSTGVTTTLLSLGADVSVIPHVFYKPYIDDPPSKAPFTSQRYREFDESNKRWCSEWMRPTFARAVNLSQRYFLEKTFKDKRPSDRQLQVALTHKATALLGISYFMIGQAQAATSVTQKLLSHMALPRSRPLVMVFCGPSGHGKTELAKRMGELLTLEMECIDCTEMRYETDLFGPKKPYIGHELGSPLNNFLARLTGRRGIVFLDEIEKTTKEVQNALLVPFDEGKYTDRRNRTLVDCSKIIWIIATNALDDTILDFCDIYQGQVYSPEDSMRHAELMTDLSNRLKQQLKSTFGNPFTGRVSLAVPFLPFSPTEAAVVAHKYVLELQHRALQSIQLSSGRQLVGRIQLDIRQDGAICKLIAEEGYDADQGARSLKAAVESRIADELVQKYLEEEGLIVEEQPVVKYVVDLSRRGDLHVYRVS